jgi:TM2 domain-containing membrane protein YozV
VALEKEDMGAFTEASVLYERIIFQENDQTQLYNAIIGKINCLKKQNKYTEATQFIQTNHFLISDDSIHYKLYEEWILCSYLSSQLEQALSLIEQTQLLFPAYIDKRWLSLLKILCLNEQLQWHDAQESYKQWLMDAKLDTSYVLIYKEVPKLKNSNKAAWLSTFIPGGGEFYVGKPFEALASILLQSAFLYYGINCYESKYYFSALFIGAGLAGSFHTGGVKRAEDLANQYNKKVTATFNEKVRVQLLHQIKALQ